MALHTRTNCCMIPGLVGLKLESLVCTKSGSGRTRSIISWSLGLGCLARREDTMTLVLGLEHRGPSTSSTGLLLLAGGFTWPGLRLFSSRLSSNESIVSSKNCRHSCSSWLRNCSASSSCQGQETVGNQLTWCNFISHFNFYDAHTAILLLSEWF